MKPQQSSGSPPNWHTLETERRITRLEVISTDHGERIADLEDSAPTWTPRDYMTAAAGVIVVLLAITGKITWLQAVGVVSGQH
jgi:hypothetical protein